MINFYVRVQYTTLKSTNEYANVKVLRIFGVNQHLEKACFPFVATVLIFVHFVVVHFMYALLSILPLSVVSRPRSLLLLHSDSYCS